MSLTVPPLTFRRDEKLGEYLPKDEVSALITALQGAHKEAVSAALKPVQEENARLDAAHKEADKAAKKLATVEAELASTKAAHERHTTLSELLGVTDPADIADIAAIHASRTAGQDKPPSLRDWVTAQQADPEKAPSTLRPYLEQAPERPEPAGAGGGQPTAAPQRQQVQTGGGRVQPATGGKRLDVDGIRAAAKQGASASDLIRQFRIERGLPVGPEKKVDTSGGTK